MNQSIVGLSPLSETTYPTGHDIPLRWDFVKIITLIKLFVQGVCNSCLSSNDYFYYILAKILKVRIHYLAAFWQTNPLAKSHA
jgi:hypothetical protein